MPFHTLINTYMKATSMYRTRLTFLVFTVVVLGSTATGSLFAADTAVDTVSDATTLLAAKTNPEAPTSDATNLDAPTPEGAKNAQAEPPADAPSPSAEPKANDIQHMAEPTNETHRKVFQAFRNRFPALQIDSITDGPYPGLFEVITDSQIVYVDEGMTLLFQGEMINLTDGINLTEARLAGIHMGLINELGEENMLVYKGANEADRSITVFTDINCGYCRLLHSEIDTLLQAGINVRYLMFPRAGLESESRTALESVWCADNPQEAMTAAKAGEPVVEKSCDTPVETHYELAGQVGLRGTPLIYLDNGTAIPGYREASAIVEMINTSEPMSN